MAPQLAHALRVDISDGIEMDNQAWVTVQSRQMALSHCVGAGDVAGAEQLLRSGADANWRHYSSHDLTPLHEAIVTSSAGSRTGVARVLLTYGADTEAKSYGRTPLQGVVSRGQLELIELLLEAGADVDAVDGRHATALQDAACFCLPSGHDGSGIRALLEYGASLMSERDDCCWSR